MTRFFVFFFKVFLFDYNDVSESILCSGPSSFIIIVMIEICVNKTAFNNLNRIIVFTTAFRFLKTLFRHRHGPDFFAGSQLSKQISTLYP